MKNIKKIIFIFVLSIIILSSLNLSLGTTGIVDTPAVRIRETASTDAEILTKAYEGDEVEIIGEEGDWYKISVNGEIGFARKDLIKTGEEIVNSNINEIDDEDISTYETDTTSNEEIGEENNIIIEDIYVKVLPNFGSNNIKLITVGTEVELKKELNNWIEVTVNGVSGWILKNKLGSNEDIEIIQGDEEATEEVKENEEETTEETASGEEETNSTTRNSTGTVNVETANVRAETSTSASIIGHLDLGDEVTIVEEVGDWYKITNEEIETGYVSKALITISEVSSRNVAETRMETLDASSNKGQELVEFAKQYLGYSYVLGGDSPETGFDCSGFTKYIFKNFGYSLGSTAANQNSIGTEIAREELKVGDLILFYDEANTKIGHTGIYIGEDQFIHSANPERGVVIDGFSTNSYYSSRFVTARRIVE